ncbi:flagellar export protein FliJ [Parasalinivibrio latis]|uniref:flagellar export protein FliJ n=1 Tax=Parasalinivibrio latis TaxID=2952610 RepID=UPI0030E49787
MRRLKVVQGWCGREQEKLDRLQGEAGEIRRQHRAHEERLKVLEDLSGQYGFSGGSQTSALMMKGTARFRSQLESLTALQRHELMMSDVELRSINDRVIAQHRQVKMGEKVVDKRLKQHAVKQARQEQKVLDELAMRAGLRRKF